MDHPRPWLRLVDTDDLDDSVVNFGKLKVRNRAGDTLGNVEGFVIDRDSGRPFYVVVDAGGWFKSKHFLLPIGHAQLDDDRDAIVTDLGKEHVDRFPGFDKDEFEKLSDADVRRIAEETSVACGFTDVRVAVWDRETYRQPSWWQTNYYRPDWAGSAERRAASPSSTQAGGSYADRPRADDREAVVASGGETSPHLGGRAEPGDVIGIETGGERTFVGDTKASEDDRRRHAEKDAAKKQRD